MLSIGERINKLRASTNTSLDALSEYLGVSEYDLRSIENGTASSITSDIVEKLSDLYFCSADYILNGIGTIDIASFDYSGFNKYDLEGIANIFKAQKNQEEMDKILDSAELSEV